MEVTINRPVQTKSDDKPGLYASRDWRRVYLVRGKNITKMYDKEYPEQVGTVYNWTSLGDCHRVEGKTTITFED